MFGIRKTMLIAMIAGMAGVAQAGTLSGNAAMASADVVFTNPSQLTNTLTAVANLTAGEIKRKTLVAEGMLTTTDGQPHHYALRIAGAPETSNNVENDYPAYSIFGKNNNSHKIDVFLSYSDGTGSSVKSVGGKRYIVTTQSTDKLNYSVRIDQARTVAADIYTIQTEAWLYNI